MRFAMRGGLPTAPLAAAALAGVGIALSAAPSSAQVPFRALRPREGATVRETVKIMYPRAALRDVAYFTIFMDDKFRNAIDVPKPDLTTGKPVKSNLIVADDRMVTLLWDTKGLVNKQAMASAASDEEKDRLAALNTSVDDGQHVLQVTAYDAKGQRVGRQTLTLNVSNRGGISIPSGGVPMTLRFRVGDESRYNQVTSVKYIGEPGQGGQGTSGLGGSAYTGNVTGRAGGYGGPGGSGGYSGRGGYSGATSSSGPPPGYGGRGGGSFQGGGGGRGGYSGAMTSSGPPPGYGGGSGSYSGGGRGGGRGGFSGATSSSGPPPGYGGSGSYGGRGGGGLQGGGGFQGGSGIGGYRPAPQQAGPAIIPVQDVRAEYERSTEDLLTQGTYFVRDKVIGGTIISGNGSASLLDQVFDFKSRYRTIASSGAIYSTAQASEARPGAYVAALVPNLGGGVRRVGQIWTTQTPVLLEWATLDVPPTVKASNKLVGLEWQDGYRTARIEQTFNGTSDMPIFGGAGTMKGAKVKMNRTIWLAFQTGKIVRMETTTEVDGQAPSDILSAMVPSAGVGGGGGFGNAGSFGGLGGFSGGSGGAFGGTRGGDEEGPASSGSSFGGGFGGVQQQEAPPVPAKFRSYTTMGLQAPATTRTVVRIAARKP